MLGMRNLFLSFMLLLSSDFIFAYDFEIDGIYYNLDAIAKSVTVTNSPKYNYEGAIKIPASVNYSNQILPVVSIGESAFFGCRSLTSVEIPNSITKIGSKAFQACTSLTSIEIPKSVTVINERAFYGCSSLKSIEIPNSVTIIWYSAFGQCDNLKELIIEDGETYLKIRTSSDSFMFGNNIENLFIGRNLDGKNLLNCRELITISLGKYVKNTGEILNYSIASKLEKIYCYNPEPPITPNFTNIQYANVEVFVPEGAKESYMDAVPWKYFWNISDINKAGVNSVSLNSDLSCSVYSINGILIKKDCKVEDLKTLDKGIYIIVSGKTHYKISI